MGVNGEFHTLFVLTFLLFLQVCIVPGNAKADTKQKNVLIISCAGSIQPSKYCYGQRDLLWFKRL